MGQFNLYMFTCTYTHTHTGEDVVIGFQQTSYMFSEGSTVTVCIEVFNGTIGNRTFTVNYQTSDGTATCKLHALWNVTTVVMKNMLVFF